MATELGSAFISVGLGTNTLSKDIKRSMDGAGDAGSAAGKAAGGGFSSGFKSLVGPALAFAGAAVFGGLIGEAARASDATDKFKATMNFAGIDTSGIEAATAASKAYADQTVYDLPTIQNTMAQLASNGIADYQGLTKAAGNLNAVAGGNAETFKSVGMVMTQTAGAGKLTTENWNQLADAIPGASGPLQEAMKKNGAFTGNFRDAMAAGEITADEFNAALTELGSDPIAVEAARSTATFEGALGNLQATITTGLMGALDALKPMITGAMTGIAAGLGASFTWIGNAFTGLKDLFVNGDFTGALSTAFGVEEDSPVVDMLFKIRDAAIDLGGQFKTAFAGIGPVFSGLGAAFGPLIPQILEMATSFSPLGLIFQALTPVLPQIAELFGTIASTLGGVLVGAMVQLQPMIQLLVQHLSGLAIAVMPSLSSLITVFSSAITLLVPVIMSVLAALMPLILSLVSQLSPIIINLVSTVLPPLIAIFSEVVLAIAPLITQIAEMLIPIITALLPVVVTVFSVVSEVIKSAMQIVQGIIQVVTGLIRGDWETVWTGVQNIFSGIWETIKTVISGAIEIVKTTISSGLELAKTYVSNAMTSIGTFFSDAWTTITTGVSGFITGVENFFKELPGKITGAVSGVAESMKTIGQDIIQGLIDGASGMVENAVQAVKDVGGAMLDGIKGMLGIKSPSRVFKAEVGMMIGAGLIAGIDKSKAGVTRSVNSLVSIPPVPSFSAPSYSPTPSSATATAGVSIGTVHVRDENEMARVLMNQQRDAQAVYF